MDDLEQKIQVIAEDIIKKDSGFFLVDVRVKGNSGNQKVIVLVDGDKGINIDQCGKISREIGRTMEELDFVPGKYTLEVSSPGLDHPIKLSRQYLKNTGRELEVALINGEKVTGKLIEVKEEEITIEAEDSNQVISFKEILQSKVLVSFK